MNKLTKKDVVNTGILSAFSTLLNPAGPIITGLWGGCILRSYSRHKLAEKQKKKFDMIHNDPQAYKDHWQQRKKELGL